MRICCHPRDNCLTPIMAAMSNIRREPRGKRRGLWNYCVSSTLHEIVRLLFSFFNELQLQGI